MARTTRAQPSNPTASELDGYWFSARRPLHMLVFLTPLVIGYEIALMFLLRGDGQVLTNLAHKSLLQFFDLFGLSQSGGLLLGGIAIAVVLLLWHILNGDRWTINWRHIGLMALEAIGLAVPLLMFSQLIGNSPAAYVLAGSPPTDLAQLDWLSRIAISVGAGLYEELAFRMLLIAAVHTLLVDLGKLPHTIGAALAVVISAAAFTWYHPLGNGAGGISTSRLIFFFTAGLYFGLVYVLRGFGIVVAVHAFYDIVTVSALSWGE